MSGLEFLSPDLARRDGGFDPVATSPLARALRGSQLRDLSALGKLDVRGDVDLPSSLRAVRTTPRRALVLCAPEDVARLREELAAVDLTAALAGLQIDDERLLRRLTDLDLEALPAAGAVAGVPGILTRDGDSFQLFFAQELADHVAEVVLDALEGLR